MNEVGEHIHETMEKGLVLTFDFENAYDRVDYSFLERVMETVWG